MQKVEISGSYVESFLMNVLPFSLFLSLIAIARTQSVSAMGKAFIFVMIVVTIIDFSIIYFWKFTKLSVIDDFMIFGDEKIHPADIDSVVSTTTAQGWNKEIWFIQVKGSKTPFKILAKRDIPLLFSLKRKFKSRSMKILLQKFPFLQEKIVFGQNAALYERSLEVNDR